MDFGQFSTSGTPRSAQNAAPGALVKNASNLDGFWDAFFRIFMDLGSQIGGQKGFPKKESWTILQTFAPQNGVLQIFWIFRDYPQFSTKFPDVSTIFQYFFA